MALLFPPEDAPNEDFVATINTTPLVDVMMVLLIIFLITIPVVTHTVPVDLPKEVITQTQTKPQNIIIAVDRDGHVFWNQDAIEDMAVLLERMKVIAVLSPQPEVHIRGDREARYASIGKVVTACQRAGVVKVGFITEPTARGG